jgi:integrase/recombinase XerD
MPSEGVMNDPSLIGSWIRRFLVEHLVSERNLARNTRLNYRDALTLLLPFISGKQRKSVDQLHVTDLTPDLLRSFLADLESTRHSSIATRNQRLAAVHSLAAFIGAHSPEHIQWCAQVRAVPFKKTASAAVGYLDKPEMDGLLVSPDRRTVIGRRDYALLLFLYNSGARADETARLTIGDLNLYSSSVRIVGKGGKQRHCPLWRVTVAELSGLIGNRNDNERVFLNRYGQPMTRFGIHTLVERYAQKARRLVPSMAKKRVSPHIIRHSTACHLLRAGVDINTIRGWLGHVSLETTNIYAEIDLSMKANALSKCEVHAKGKPRGRWHQPALMEFLRSL